MTDKPWGVNSEYGVLHDVLLGPPDNFHWLPTSSISKASLRGDYAFDHAAALTQHQEMVSAYESAGVTCHFLQSDKALPYQVYARDSSVMTPYGAVICQMHQWWRRGEYASVIHFYQDNDIPIFNFVTAAAFEGGDFNVIEPQCVLIGYCGERSEEPAAKQVAGWFEARGWEARLAPIDSFYVHIDLMVCMIAPKLAAVCIETTEDDVLEWLKSKRIEIVPVSFENTMELGCNIVSLGNDRVLSTRAAKDLNQRLKARGFEIYDPDVSMFTRGGGGVHCLCQPLRRDPV